MIEIDRRYMVRLKADPTYYTLADSKVRLEADPTYYMPFRFDQETGPFSAFGGGDELDVEGGFRTFR